MLEYFRKNPLVSFGFVAAPDLDKDIKNKKVNRTSGSRRFKFYQRMMINLFGPETFYQVSDTTNTIYLLVNMSLLSQGTITLKDIERKINLTYSGDYLING